MINKSNSFQNIDAYGQFSLFKVNNLPIFEFMTERDYFIFSNMVVYKYPIDIVYAYLVLLSTNLESQTLLVESGIYKFCLDVLAMPSDIFIGTHLSADTESAKMLFDFICQRLISKTVKYYISTDKEIPEEIAMFQRDNNFSPSIHSNKLFTDRAVQSIWVSGVSGFLYVVVRSMFNGFKGPMLLNAVCTAIITPFIIPRVFFRRPSIKAYKETPWDNFIKISKYSFWICLIPMCLISKNYWFPVTYSTLFYYPFTKPFLSDYIEPVFNWQKLPRLTINDWYYDNSIKLDFKNNHQNQPNK